MDLSLSNLVADAPEIEVAEVVIHTALGDEEEIVCTVHALPHAEVTWVHDGRAVDRTTSNVLINQKHGRYSLTLLSIDEASVGQYWCRASNSMGQDRKGVTVTGNYNGITSNQCGAVLVQGQQ